MTIRIAGAALAACVSVCALMGEASVQRAEAAEIGAGGVSQYEIGDDGEIDFNFYADISKGVGYFTIDDYVEVANGNNDRLMQTVNHASITYFSVTSTNDSFSTEIGLTGKTQEDIYTDSYGNVTNNSGSIITRYFTVTANNLSITNPENDTFSTMVINSLGEGQNSVYIYPYFDGFTPYVPLPASAPLFGTALLMLGGMSWAARRRSPHCATAPTG